MGTNAAMAFQAASGLATGIGELSAAGKHIQVPDAYVPTTNPAAGAMSMQESAIQQQQQIYAQQADQTILEASLAAQQKAQDVANYRENQALQYSSSGVMLAGSPLLELNRTVALGSQEVAAIASRGNAQANLLRMQAYAQGLNGRASLIGDQANWITQLAQAQAGAVSNKARLQAGINQAQYQMTENALGNIAGVLGKGISMADPDAIGGWLRSTFNPGGVPSTLNPQTPIHGTLPTP